MYCCRMHGGLSDNDTEIDLNLKILGGDERTSHLCVLSFDFFRMSLCIAHSLELNICL